MMRASIFAAKHLLKQFTRVGASESVRKMKPEEWLSQLILTQEAINCQIVGKGNDDVSTALLQNNEECT